MGNEVGFLITGNAAGLVAATGQATGALGALEGTANRVGSAIEGTFRVAATVAAAAGAAVAAGLTASVTAAAGFERQMSAVSAVAGASAQQMQQLSSLALQLGKDTSFSATEAAQGLEELVKAGVSIQDIMGGGAKGALDLAAAGAVSVKDAAEIAANAMNAFGLKGSDMARIADTIAGAANASAIDVNEFKFSLSAVGAVAATVGVGFEDTATAIALLGNAGIKGSDAGTSLKTMLMNLQPSTKAQTEEFKRLGLITADGANQFFDATGKAKSLADISGILQQATAGMTDQQKLASLELMFGTDAIRAAAVMTKAGSAGFNDLAQNIGKISAADVAAARLDNLSGDIEKLKGSLETAGIIIGRAFLPGLRMIVQGATNVLNASMPMIEAFSERIPAAMERARAPIVAVGASLMAVATGTIPAVQRAYIGLESAAGRLVGLDLDEYASGWDTLGGIATRVGDIIRGRFVGALDLLQRATPRLRSALIGLQTDIAKLLGIDPDEVAAGWDTTFAIMRRATELALPPIRNLATAIADNWAKSIQFVTGILPSLGRATVATFGFLGAQAPAIGRVADTLRVILGESIIWLAEHVWPRLLDIAGQTIQFFDSRIRPSLDGVASTLRTVLGGAIEWVAGTAWPRFLTIVGTVWDYISGTVMPRLPEFATGLQGLIGGALTWLATTGVPRFLDGLTTVAAFIAGPGRAALSSLWDWLGPKLSAALDWLGSTGWPALRMAAVTALNWIAGPGIAAVSALWSWLSEKLPPVISALATTFEQVRRRVAPIVEALFNGDIRKAIDGMGSAFADLGRLILGWVGDQVSRVDWAAVWGRAQNVIVGMAGWFADVGASILGWIGDQVARVDWVGVWNRATDVAAGMADWFADAATHFAGWLGDQVGRIDWDSVWSRATNVLATTAGWFADAAARFAGWLGAQVGRINWGDVWGQARNVTTQMVGWFRDAGARFTDWLGNQAARINWDDVWSHATDVAAGMVGWFGDVYQRFTTWLGQQVARVDWDAVWRQARGQADIIARYVIAEVQGLDTALSRALGQQIASVNWGEVGREMGRNFWSASATGMSEETGLEAPKIRAAIGDFFHGVTVGAWESTLESWRQQKPGETLGKEFVTGLDSSGMGAGVLAIFDKIRADLKTWATGASSDLSAAWDDMWRRAGEAWDAIKALLGQKWTAITGEITTTLGIWGQALSEGWDAKWRRAGEAWDAITTLLGQKWAAITEAVGTTLAGWGQALSDGWDDIWRRAGEAWDAITTLLGQKWTAITDAVTTTIGGWAQVLSDGWDGIWRRAGEAWDAVWTLLGEKWTAITGLVTQGIADAARAMSEGWNAIWSRAGEAWDAIWSLVGQKGSDVVGAIKNQVTEWADAGKALGEGLVNAVKGAMANLVETVLGPVKATVAGVRGALGLGGGGGGAPAAPATGNPQAMPTGRPAGVGEKSRRTRDEGVYVDPDGTIFEVRNGQRVDIGYNQEEYERGTEITGQTQSAAGSRRYSNKWEQKAHDAAVKAGHPNPTEFVEQMRLESANFDENVIAGRRNSSAGAQGIAQIMPNVSRAAGVDPLDPDAALAYAANRMTQNYQRYGGDRERALAEYNMGAGNLQRYGPRGLPETNRYITVIGNRTAEQEQQQATGQGQEQQATGQRYAFPVPAAAGTKVNLHHGSAAGTGAADIFAPRGSSVVSVADSTVLGAGQIGMGGNYVLYRDNEGRVYYNAHLNNDKPMVTAGQRLTAGQQIGEVGDTGNARGTGPHLHIGIGKGQGWDAIQSGGGPTGGAGRGFNAVEFLEEIRTGKYAGLGDKINAEFEAMATGMMDMQTAASAVFDQQGIQQAAGGWSGAIIASGEEVAAMVPALLDGMGDAVITGQSQMGDQLMTVYRNSTGQAMAVFTDMSGNVVGVVDSMGNSIFTASQSMTSGFATIATSVAEMGGSVTTAADGTLTAVTGLADGTMTVTQDMAGTLTATVTDASGAVVGSFTGMSADSIAHVVEMGEGVQGTAAALSSSFQDQIGSMADGSMTTFETMGDTITETTTDASGNVTRTVRDMSGNVLSETRTMTGEVTGEFDSLKTDATGSAEQLHADVADEFDTMAGDATSAAGTMATDVTGEADTMASDAAAAAVQMAQDIINEAARMAADAEAEAAVMKAGVTGELAVLVTDSDRQFDAFSGAVGETIGDVNELGRALGQVDHPVALTFSGDVPSTVRVDGINADRLATGDVEAGDVDANDLTASDATLRDVNARGAEFTRSDFTRSDIDNSRVDNMDIARADFPSAPGRARGGPVRRGETYIVGEERPELFVPDQNGTILPRVPAFAATTTYGYQSAPAIDEARLARLIARELRANPPAVYLDGEPLTRGTRTHNRRYESAQPSNGVGGF